MSTQEQVLQTASEQVKPYTLLLSTLSIKIMFGKNKSTSLQIPMTNVDKNDNEVMEIKPLLDDSEEEAIREIQEDKPESLCRIFSQVSLPFLIAGLGTVGAGLVLDFVQHWKVFHDLPEMFILVPSLLGLKGNLEMTLASRLSTQANLGNLDNLKDQWKMATGNLALVQCQAIVVGFLASLFAVVVDYVGEGEFNLDHAILLGTSSLITACLASFLLGLVTIGVVILSRKLRINPDNVAAPVAASFGDVITLTLLAYSSRILYCLEGGLRYWIQVPVIVVLISLVPLWWIIARRNEYTRQVLYTGWTPVISAVVIASAGGYILDTAVSQYKEMAVFQPVINGVGGNLAAVQASRISTSLHQRVKLGTLPQEENKRCISPLSAFFGKSIHVRTANLLVLIVIPGHLIFLAVIHVLKVDSPNVPFLFYLFYPMAALIQVCILLYTAYCMIHWMWKWSIDPDNSAIPYLTALGDLLGTALLAVVFYILDPGRDNTQKV